jgi:hypothetical protein
VSEACGAPEITQVYARNCCGYPEKYAIHGQDMSIRDASSKKHIVQDISFGDTSSMASLHSEASAMIILNVHMGE